MSIEFSVKKHARSMRGSERGMWQSEKRVKQLDTNERGESEKGGKKGKGKAW